MNRVCLCQRVQYSCTWSYFANADSVWVFLFAPPAVYSNSFKFLALGNLQVSIGRDQTNLVAVYNSQLQSAFVTWQEGGLVFGRHIAMATRPVCFPRCSSGKTCAMLDICVSESRGKWLTFSFELCLNVRLTVGAFDSGSSGQKPSPSWVALLLCVHSKTHHPHNTSFLHLGEKIIAPRIEDNTEGPVTLGWTTIPSKRTGVEIRLIVLFHGNRDTASGLVGHRARTKTFPWLWNTCSCSMAYCIIIREKRELLL